MFEVKFDTDNDMFQGWSLEPEVTRILQCVAKQFTDGDWIENKWSNIRDSNGNSVGKFRYTKD